MPEWDTAGSLASRLPLKKKTPAGGESVRAGAISPGGPDKRGVWLLSHKNMRMEWRFDEERAKVER
jgi:hypothetical protein